MGKMGALNSCRSDLDDTDIWGSIQESEARSQNRIQRGNTNPRRRGRELPRRHQDTKVHEGERERGFRFPPPFSSCNVPEAMTHGASSPTRTEATAATVGLRLGPPRRIPDPRYGGSATRRIPDLQPAHGGFPTRHGESTTCPGRSSTSRMFGSGDARGGAAVHAHVRGEDR